MNSVRAVMFRMVAARLNVMMLGVAGVTVRAMGMVRRLFMIARLVMLGGFAMMLRGMLVVLGGLMMMVFDACVVVHVSSPG
jgi:hypothetical protein